jgi:hypothetical protein
MPAAAPIMAPMPLQARSMLEGTRLGRKFCSVSSARLSAGAGQRRQQGRGGDAQPRLQRRHQQEAERDVGEDVGRQVEAGVVARPGGGEEVERRRAGVAPAESGCRLAYATSSA